MQCFNKQQDLTVSFASVPQRVQNGLIEGREASGSCGWGASSLWTERAQGLKNTSVVLAAG